MMSKKQLDILQDKRIINIITNNVQSGLFLMDNKTRIIWANEKFQKWFGSIKGIIGKPCSYFIENHKKKHCACLRTLKTKKFETGAAHGAIQGTENIFFNSFSTPIFDRKGRMAYMMGEIKDITNKKKAEESLRRIEWLLTKSLADKPGKKKRGNIYQPSNRTLLKLNTSRLILDSVGQDVLAETANSYLELLETSSAIYEKNGDYALGIFTSGWCRFLDKASRRLCRTKDNKKALASGKWLCHESCWNDASRKSIERGKPVDIECNGGIRLYAVPIRAGKEIVGSINFGYSDPPKERAKLDKIARKYDVSSDKLLELANSYESRPPFIIDIAKKNLLTSAKLIGEITKRKKVEDEIKKQKLKAEKYLDLAGSIIVALDSAGRIILLNKKGYEILGYKKGKLIGERWIDTCIPQKDRADVRKIFHKIMQGNLKIAKHFENPIITKQGDRRIISWHNSVLNDDNGEIIGTLSSGNDITDKKKAEEEIKANETRFRLLYEDAPLGYQSLDKDGRVIELNKTWLEMLGYSKDKVIGKPFSDFITRSYKETFKKGFLAFKNRGWLKNSEYEMIRKDGTHILVSIDGRVAYDEKGQFLKTHCIIHDIAKRKEAEAKVKKYAEELEDMVRKRTRELDETNQKLRERIDELERFHNLVVGRELKMIELKKEIKRLESLVKKRK